VSMDLRDLVEVAVAHANRCVYMFLALSSACVAAYGLVGDPRLLLLSPQLTSALFVALLSYSYLKRLLGDRPSRGRVLAILVPSSSSLFGIFSAIWGVALAVSSAVTSAVLAVILGLSLYSALRDYDVVMRA